MTALLGAAFLLLQLLCQLLVTVECVCELPCGYERYPDGNTSYKIYTYGLTWDEARDECASEGAKLAIATTFEKIEYIQNRGEAGKSLWIGIHRPEGIGGDWVRIDTDKNVKDIPWDNLTDGDDENCAVMRSMKRPLEITNYDCDRKFWFVCEISYAEGCPDLVRSL